MLRTSGSSVPTPRSPTCGATPSPALGEPGPQLRTGPLGCASAPAGFVSQVGAILAVGIAFGALGPDEVVSTLAPRGRPVTQTCRRQACGNRPVPLRLAGCRGTERVARPVALEQGDLLVPAGKEGEDQVGAEQDRDQAGGISPSVAL